MKFIKTLSICILLLISTKLFSQSYNPKLLMIEIHQSSSYIYNEIIVTENSVKLEEIPLSAWNYKHTDSNQITINKTLAKYLSLNYKLISSVRGTIVTQTHDTIMVTTYLFEKE